MVASPAASITEHFGTLKDPRVKRTRRHTLFDMLTITLCAGICGADDWVEVELFGKSKEAWFRTFLELPNGIPSHDTFGRLFARLDPEELRRCFISWVQAITEVTRGQVIAIDGKTARRSHDRANGKRALHMVNVWASANGIALGQAKVDEKSNEITAIPELLQMLDVAGCIVTIDAMGCQKEIAQEIVRQGADYVLAVKGNQGGLYEDIRDLFTGAEGSPQDAVPMEASLVTTKGHGRIETRECRVIHDVQTLEYVNEGKGWAKLQALVEITGKRRIGDAVTLETRYYISSLSGDAKRLGEAVREHWSIENSLHWVLDIAFREDESRLRKDHAPENMAMLRQMTLNLLKQETSVKAGIKAKRLKAGWDNDYLLRILMGA